MPIPNDDVTDRPVSSAEGNVSQREQEFVRPLDSRQLVDTLQTVTDAVTGKATIEDALSDILGSAISLVGAEAGTLQIIDTDTQTLSLAAESRVPIELQQRFATLAADPGSFYQQACETHEQIVIADAASLSDDHVNRRILAHGGFSAVVATPLVSGSGHCKGLLTLYFRSPLAVDETPDGALDLLARQVLTVLQHRQQRARLTELVATLRKRTGDLESSERKLTVQAAELHAQDESRESFISMLGHELRNPLAAILNSLELIDLTSRSGKDVASGKRLAATTDSALGVIKRQSQHLRRLIDDLLDINRLSRGKLVLQLETVNINRSIEEVINLARPRLDARNLELRLSTPDEPVYVVADPERIAQIADNLLRNAISFTGAGGKISIALHHESSFAAITVRDNGIGMDEKSVNALFESDASRLSGAVDGGLGLGLLLVRQLVNLHGGAISAKSDGVGKGSEFTVRLPLAAAVKASVAPDEPAGLELPPPHRVLVVDDKPDNADALSAVLARFGQQVKTAYSGESALEAARQFSPDVAFLDLSMPVMDGYELAERLRAQFSDDHLTLIALTGQPHMQQSALFDHHLMKPMQADRIIELLNDIGTCH